MDFFLKTTTFIYLSVQMYFHNYFEFDRIWLKLFWYFLIDAISNALCIYIYTFERLELPRIDALIVFYFMNLPQIIVGIGILHLKDSKDML